MEDFFKLCKLSLKVFFITGTDYCIEAAGKAFIFAISRPARLSTYNMDVKISEDLYNLGRRDYAASAAALRAFLGV